MVYIVVVKSIAISRFLQRPRKAELGKPDYLQTLSQNILVKHKQPTGLDLDPARETESSG